MTPQQHRDYQAILREDFTSFAQRCFLHLNPGVTFTPGWHIHVVGHWMSRCEDAGRRMIINLPPRHLKSLLGSIALPAWLLGRDPTEKIICASYGAELAHKLSRDCRSIMASGWYKDLFPGTRLERYAVHELVTTRGGGRLATSVDGTLTGLGADLIIIDDPLKPDEALSDSTRAKANQWFDNTLYTRLNDKQYGRILLIMQRLHEDDLTGHLLAHGGWQHLSLPAIATRRLTRDFVTPLGVVKIKCEIGDALHPEREPLDVLEQIRRTIGEYNFAGQYQQSPAPLDGGMVKRGWFPSYGARDLPDRFELILQSWDTANKPTELSDYSVCTTWGLAGNRIYLLHVLRKKLDYPSLKRAVLEQARLHNAEVVLIEDKASGTQLIQELSFERLKGVTPYKPDSATNKKMRLHAQTGVMENGLVFLPAQAEWLDGYLHELTTFPASKHDDQVDSTSQALHWISLRNNKPEPGIIEYYRLQVEKQKEYERSLFGTCVG